MVVPHHTDVGRRVWSMDRPSLRAAEVFVEWLVSDESDVVQSMFDAVAAATPEVLNAGVADEERLLAALRSHMPVIREVVLEGALDPDIRLPRAAEQWARHLADVRIDLSVLILAYDAAGTMVLESFASWMRGGTGSLAVDQRADALEVAMERIFRYLRSAGARAAAAYAHQAEQIRRREESDVQDTVDAVLEGSLGEAEAERRLGIRLGVHHVGLILWGTSGDPVALQRAMTRIRHLTHARQQVVVPRGGRTLHVWLTAPAVNVADVREKLELPGGVQVAFGTLRSGVEGFRATHREALEARRLAYLLGQGNVTGFDDVAILSMTSADVDAARDFVRRHLGPLVEPEHAELLTTVAVWLDELGSPTRAAKRLTMHPNGVVKRLERAGRLRRRPLDPTDFSLRLATHLAPHVTC